MIPAIECDTCKALHRVESNTYTKILGTIFIGKDGGLYGPNGDLAYCAKFDCLQWLLKNIAPDAIKKVSILNRGNKEYFEKPTYTMHNNEDV